MKRYVENPVFFFTAIFAFTILKMWLVSAIPLTEIWAGHDDQHFVSQAINIIREQWLGGYDQLTLIKGPAYPAWIALLYQLEIPLLKAQTAIYIAACFCFAMAIKKIAGSFFIATIGFIILALYLETIPRVIREGLYVPLTLGIFGLLALCYQNLSGRLWLLIMNLSLLGLILSVFWMTREEGVWLLPSLSICLGCAIYTLVSASDLSRQNRLLRVLLLALPAVILSVCLTQIKSVNEHYYQSYNVVEMHDAAFIGAYGSLSRVIPPQKIQYVPVTQATLRDIYRESPSFRLLKPYLEKSKWLNAGCSLYQEVCGELAGGWFMWALRDAVADAGFYHNGNAAQNYYRKLKQEVDRACDLKTVPCLPERQSMLPVIDKSDAVNIWNSFQHGLIYVFSLKTLSLDYLGSNFSKASTGVQESLNHFKQVIKGEFVPLESNPSITTYRIQKAKTPQYLMYAEISQYYVFWWPLALASALILYGVNLFYCLRKQQLNFNIVFNTALITAVLARILILAIIDATSFSGINEVYLSPVYPLVLAFIILSHIDFYLRLNLKNQLSPLKSRSPLCPPVLSLSKG